MRIALLAGLFLGMLASGVDYSYPNWMSAADVEGRWVCPSSTSQVVVEVDTIKGMMRIYSQTGTRLNFDYSGPFHTWWKRTQQGLEIFALKMGDLYLSFDRRGTVKYHEFICSRQPD